MGGYTYPINYKGEVVNTNFEEIRDPHIYCLDLENMAWTRQKQSHEIRYRYGSSNAVENNVFYAFQPNEGDGMDKLLAIYENIETNS